MALKIPPSSSSDFSFYRSISLSEPFPSLSHSHQLSHWTCPNTELLMMPCRLLLLCHYNLSPEHPLTDHSMLAAPGEDTEDKLPSCTPCLLPWDRSLRKLKPVTLILMSQKNRERWQKGGGKKHSRTDSEHVFLCCEQGASSSDCMCPNSPKVSLKLSIAERLQSSSKDSHYFSADTCLFTLVKIHLLDLITGDWITLCCLCAVDSPWRKGAHQ